MNVGLNRALQNQTFDGAQGQGSIPQQMSSQRQKLAGTVQHFATNIARPSESSATDMFHQQRPSDYQSATVHEHLHATGEKSVITSVPSQPLHVKFEHLGASP